MSPTDSRGPLSAFALLVIGVMVMLGARQAPHYGHVALAAASDPCTVSCGQDWDLQCSLDEHVAEEGYAVDQEGPHGSHNDCEPEKCAWEDGPAEMHPSCLSLANLARSGDYDRLKAAIAAQDARTVERLMGRYSKVLVVNARRESIQVMSCDGVPKANLPLDPQQYQRIAAAQ